MQEKGSAAQEGPLVERYDGLLGSDLAGTYKDVRRAPDPSVDPAQVERDWSQLQEQGFVVIEGLLPGDRLAEIQAALAPHLGPKGRNRFEGLRTQRVYGVLEKTRAVDRLVDHPRVLALLDRLFEPNYLLSAMLGIHILPGEDAQGLHFDDGFYRLPRPRPPLGAATIWAIDEFTADNGATRVIPGSHTWESGRLPSADDPLVPVVMPAGSVVVFGGTLWHGGGANHSAAARLAVTAQYCEPWLRTQENFFLSISKSTARAVSEDLRRMLGYSIHRPFMGHSNGLSPLRTLEGAD